MNTRRVLVKAGWDASVRHLFATRGDTAVCVLCVLCVLCVQLQMQCGFLPRDAQGTGTGLGLGLGLGCVYSRAIQCSAAQTRVSGSDSVSARRVRCPTEARRGEARRGEAI